MLVATCGCYIYPTEPALYPSHVRRWKCGLEKPWNEGQDQNCNRGIVIMNSETYPLAPIVLFVYNRPWHTKQTVMALQNNKLAINSQLIIFSDAPKDCQSEDNVNKVRKYIKSITGFKSVTIIERNSNLGLSRSFIEGTTEVITAFGRIIGLEDDNVTSKYFIDYMNSALNMYENCSQVICVTGFCPPFATSLPETYFLRGAETWSYGTWKRGWDMFETDAHVIFKTIKENKLERFMREDAIDDFMSMLTRSIAGEIDSWGVKWHASAIINDCYTLYPGIPLVKNIGTDGSGTHFSGISLLKKYDCNVSENRINLIKNSAICQDAVALRAFKRFFVDAKKPSFFEYITFKLRHMLTELSGILDR